MLNKVINQIGGAEKESSDLKNKICSAVDTIVIDERKKVYYISENGDDNNNGLSPENAIKTFKKIETFVLEEGDAILLERGGIYRLESMFWIRANDIKIGAYGDGEKPLLLGSVKNYAVADIWEQTDNKNIWCTYVPKSEKRVGGIFFNGDSEYGSWKISLDKVLENGDYYNDNDNEKLYLYLENQNPGEYFDSIEISTTNAAIRASYINGLYAENINFKYFTVGAFHLGEIENITVTNCIIGWCGGGLFSYNKETGYVCRYGNAFQTWYLAKNIDVNNCWIYQQFDAALTFQGFGKEPANFVNITYKDNLIEYCSMNIEFWVGNQGKDRHLSNIENILYEGNIIRFAGYGWAGREREKMDNQASLLGWNYHYEICKNFVIKDNIIDCADCHIIYMEGPDKQEGLKVFNNTYYQKQTSGVHKCVQIVKGLDIMPNGEDELKEAILTFEEKPKLIKWLDI